MIYSLREIFYSLKHYCWLTDRTGEVSELFYTVVSNGGDYLQFMNYIHHRCQIICLLVYLSVDFNEEVIALN